MKITTAQIEALKYDAGCVGDDKMVAICDRALGGSKRAIAACKTVMLEAFSQSLATRAEWLRIRNA